MQIKRYLIEVAESVVDSAWLLGRLNASQLLPHVALEEFEDALVLELRDDKNGEIEALLGTYHPELCLRDEADLLADIGPLLSSSAFFADLPDDDPLVLRSRNALLKLGALWHSDLRLLDLLRKLAAHPRKKVRAAVIAVASRVGYQLFLLELWAGEADPVLRRILASVTAFTQGPAS
jgi:hypothetical protein